MFPGQSQQSLPLSSLSALLFVSMDDDTGRQASQLGEELTANAASCAFYTGQQQQQEQKQAEQELEQQTKRLSVVRPMCCALE